MDRLLPGLQLPAEEVLHLIKYPVSSSFQMCCSYNSFNNTLHQAGSKCRQSLVGEVWGEEGGSSFPLSCLALREDNAFCQLTVWTYSSLSGLLLLDKEGRVSPACEGREKVDKMSSR